MLAESKRREKRRKRLVDSADDTRFWASPSEWTELVLDGGHSVEDLCDYLQLFPVMSSDNVAPHIDDLSLDSGSTALTVNSVIEASAKSALHIAVEREDIEMMEMLLRNSANADVSEPKFGETPLHFAVRHSFFDGIRVLVVNGCNVLAKDKCGKTADFYADCVGTVTCIRDAMGEELRAKAKGQRRKGTVSVSSSVSHSVTFSADPFECDMKGRKSSRVSFSADSRSVTTKARISFSADSQSTSASITPTPTPVSSIALKERVRGYSTSSMEGSATAKTMAMAVRMAVGREVPRSRVLAERYAATESTEDLGHCKWSAKQIFAVVPLLAIANLWEDLKEKKKEQIFLHMRKSSRTVLRVTDCAEAIGRVQMEQLLSFLASLVLKKKTTTPRSGGRMAAELCALAVSRLMAVIDTELQTEAGTDSDDSAVFLDSALFKKRGAEWLRKCAHEIDRIC